MFAVLLTDANILQGVSFEVNTKQSGDYCNLFGTNSSHNAINGLYSPQHPGNDTDLCHRCSVITGLTLTWWEVVLVEKRLVAGVRVYGRVDGAVFEYFITQSWILVCCQMLHVRQFLRRSDTTNCMSSG